MFDVMLLLHSWLRWPALIAGIVAIVAAFVSRPIGAEKTAADRWGGIFVGLLDLQMLLGLLLYVVLSPTTAAIRQDFGAAMREPVARFWAVEHIALMMVAVIVAHIGRVLVRKARTPGSKRTRMLLTYTIATVAIVAAIPWPGFRAGRPLFRI
jgi:uncharacterized membrane protein YedE/YeeE